MKTSDLKDGDGVTTRHYSDARVWTVIKITPKTVKLQRDKATLLNGPASGEPDALAFSPGGFVGHTSGSQRYSYERNETGEVITAYCHKDGELYFENRKITAGRNEYYDFNF